METTRIHQHICWKHNKNNKLFKPHSKHMGGSFLIFKPAPFPVLHLQDMLHGIRSICHLSGPMETWTPRRKKRWEVQVWQFQTFPSHSSSNLFFLTKKNTDWGRKKWVLFFLKFDDFCDLDGFKQGNCRPNEFPPKTLGGVFIDCFLLTLFKYAIYTILRSSGVGKRVKTRLWI